MPRAELPALRGEDLAALHNAPWGAAPLVRVLAAATPAERARERDRYIRRGAAASHLRDGSQRALVKQLRGRLAKFKLYGLPSFIDVGTPDGCLQLAVLVGGRVPSATTVWRALADFHGVDDFTPVGAVKQPECHG